MGGRRPSDRVGGQGFGELAARRRPFPEGAEDMVARLSDLTSELSGFLTAGVNRFNEVVRVQRDLENEKGGLANRLALAETRVSVERAAVEAAKEAAEAAKKEAAMWKAEAEVAKRQGAEVVARQGPLLRAYTERLFRSERFSELAGQVASILSTRAVSDAINSIAADVPNLDKAKYGYQDMSDAAVNHSYAEAVLKGLKDLPVLDSLASASDVLTAEVVESWPVDRDEEMDELIADLSRTAKPEAEGANRGGNEVEEEGDANDDEASCQNEENAGVVS